MKACGDDDLRAWDVGSALRGGGWTDEVPATVLPLLERQFREQMPVVMANSAALRERLERRDFRLWATL